MAFYSFIAEASAGSGDLFSALGIDWRLLLIQIVAFSILVALLGKFVYPWLMKSIDERQKNIDAAQLASTEAQKQANQSKLEIEELLVKARKEASIIVASAKDEASAIVTTSEEKARANAERIALEAKQDIIRDVEAAKKELYNETLELVTLATEKVIGKTHSQKVDADLISASIKELK